MRSGKEINLLLAANFPSDVGYAWWLMENFWTVLAEHHVAAGRSTLLAYPKVNAIPERIAASPIEIVEHDINDRSPGSLRRLEKLVKERSVRGLYLTDRSYHDYLYWKMRRWGISRIVLHDHVPGEMPLPGFVKRQLRRMVHRSGRLSCDLYVGVSRFVYDRLIRVGCIPRERCTFVRNGIPRLPARPAEARYLRSLLPLPEDAIVVVSTGRAHVYKGIEDLVQCARMLIQEKQHERVYFVHCGDGPHLGQFRELIRTQGLEGRFFTLGRRTDVRDILASCHLALHASRGEAFSLAILEYLGAGLPAVAPDHCGNGEAISHGATGYLYPPGDVAAAVYWLDELVRDERRRRSMGEAASRAIELDFNDESMNAQFRRVVADFLLDGRRVATPES